MKPVKNPSYPLLKKNEYGEVYADLEHKIAQGYGGKRSKADFHYRYSSVEKLTEAADKYLEGLAKSAEYKADRKKQSADHGKKFLEALKPGTILTDSWGYDQTNVEFYIVISVKGKQVTVVELQHKTVEGSEGHDCCRVLPSDTATGDPVTITVRGSTLKISDSIRLSLWDGKDKYKSWYA